MKRILAVVALLIVIPVVTHAQLVITAVFDGPLLGGLPKGVELVALSDIPDLSIYGLGAANGGGGTDGEEFTFPADAVVAGSYIWACATDDIGFTEFFGFPPTYFDPSYGLSINGDDAIELFCNGVVIDVFGDINTDGTGEPWDYLDGWAYRVNNTGPDGEVFDLASWTFSGSNVFDGTLTNAEADPAMPIGTYQADPAMFQELRVEDVAFDQGGFLQLDWDRSTLDASSLPDSIITYYVQRFEIDNWTTLSSLEATFADSYSVIISTPDIFSIGEPIPSSFYRILANSSEPYIYTSVEVSGYSIDNLAPPTPDVFLVESDGFRVVVCNNPEIPDLDQVCFYRGYISGFIPDTPVQCSFDLIFNEPNLVNAFYRVQFSDIHGNLSEFSEEMTLSDPSGVGDPLPTVFSMEQNHPNPFNPSTIINFNLPESSPVNLQIYDVSGKLVRNLIAGQMMEAGRCEKVWNGCDANGQSVSAGIYFYKLTAGNFTDVRRMALVK